MKLMNRWGARALRLAVFALLGVAVAVPLEPGAAQAGHGTASLLPGETLTPGQYLVAGRYRLFMQRDGNLVLYRDFARPGQYACAASHTTAHPGSRAWMSPNGFFAVYTPQGVPVWSTRSHTNGSRWAGGWVNILSDGRALVFTGDGFRDYFQFWQC
ncbi:hypothetical protein ACQP00_34990 [Dactylosporangium sp. CS-047395]|uniref:hypothetical protein n=1 Tax=Dactylosporangium sp. CS-047395 TaxID=3239936 RepID=UPI003D89E8A7